MSTRPHNERFELKYFVTDEDIRMVRRYLSHFAEPDRYALQREGHVYTVRTIYFDTPGLRFYREKKAGLKIRKKVRFRTYNEPSSDTAGFAEIKRKYGNAVVKERVRMPLSDATRVFFDGHFEPEPQAYTSRLDLDGESRASLDRYLHLMTRLRLRPTVLVVYDREPYVGKDNHNIRITLDCNVRSAVHPWIEEIFSEDGLRYMTSRRQIMEVKFNRAMPPWLHLLTRRLNRVHEPISKYCRCLDTWARPWVGGSGAA